MRTRLTVIDLDYNERLTLHHQQDPKPTNILGQQSQGLGSWTERRCTLHKMGRVAQSAVWCLISFVQGGGGQGEGARNGEGFQRRERWPSTQQSPVFYHFYFSILCSSMGFVLWGVKQGSIGDSLGVSQVDQPKPSKTEKPIKKEKSAKIFQSVLIFVMCVCFLWSCLMYTFRHTISGNRVCGFIQVFCVYLCVFFVPQHPVLSIFLPTIHSAVAATIFTTVCIMYAAHIRMFSNEQYVCMWVCPRTCYKKVFCSDFPGIFCVSTVAYPREKQVDL